MRGVPRVDRLGKAVALRDGGRLHFLDGSQLYCAPFFRAGPMVSAEDVKPDDRRICVACRVAAGQVGLFG